MLLVLKSYSPVEISKDTIRSISNSMNLRQNSKSFPYLSIGTRRSCLIKKNRVKNLLIIGQWRRKMKTAVAMSQNMVENVRITNR
jgi:hypothetical protein